MSIKELEDQFTKYEIARILGARALQISMDAPLLLKIEKKELEELDFNPLAIARKELISGVLPITINRPLPEKKEEVVKTLTKQELEELKKKKEEAEAEEKKEEVQEEKEIVKQEVEEEKKIAEEGEIMELAKPEDEAEEESTEAKPVEV